MTGAPLLADIEIESRRIRDEVLPVGFEGGLAQRFEVIAGDPAALEAEVARHAHAGAAVVPGPSGPRSLPHRVAGKARGETRRLLVAGRRRVGPRVRSAERRGVEYAGQLAEAAATELQVASDRARRVAAGSLPDRGLRRVAPSRRAFPPSSVATPLASRLGQGGVFVDHVIDRFVFERLVAAGGSAPVLHVECGDGELVRRLALAGVVSSGADPHAPGRARSSSGGSAESSPMRRQGALEALGSVPKEALGGILVTGVTDRATPSLARAIAHLASTRLTSGGRLLLVSGHPEISVESDPVASDLALGHALHPVTWCHLLARYGLGEISVRESVDGTAYAVSAQRSDRP